MAFASAQSSRVAIGTLNWSGYTKSFQAAAKFDMLETTVLTSTAKTFIPGQDDASASLEFLLDSDGSAGNWAQTVVWAAAMPQPLSYGPFGFTTGLTAILISADLASFSETSDPGSAVSGSLDVQATGGADFGTVIEDFTSVSATGNGTSRDGLAGSTNGGVAHLHISVWSGVTSTIVTIEHSTTGIGSWSTLVTFTSATAATSQRVEVAAATTVNQFLRVVDTLTGTPVYTRAVFFARR